MPGQYYDSESGLFYNWNRYYNPAIGRYISSDPIGIDGGLNTFLYADSSPVMYIDPEGLAPDQQCVRDYVVTCAAIGITLGATAGGAGGTFVVPGVGTIAGASGGGSAGGALGAATGAALGSAMCPIDEGLAGATTNEMAKGGKQNIDNEYVREVQALPKGKRPHILRVFQFLCCALNGLEPSKITSQKTI